MQIRSVGPSSAQSLAATAATVIKNYWDKPVQHPAPPFSAEELLLIDSIYRIRLLDSKLALQLVQFQGQVTLYTDLLHSAISKTNLFSWLASSLNADVLHAGMVEADRVCLELTSMEPSQYSVVISCVEACANLGSVMHDREELVREFESNYLRVLSRHSIPVPGQRRRVASAPCGNNICPLGGISDRVTVLAGRGHGGHPATS